MSDVNTNENIEKHLNSSIDESKATAIRSGINDVLKVVLWISLATNVFLWSEASFQNDKLSIQESTLSLKDSRLLLNASELSLKDSQIKALRDSLKQYIPQSIDTNTLCIPDNIASGDVFFTKSINDIILKKANIKKIPQSLSYVIDWKKRIIDISSYVETLKTDSLILLSSLWINKNLTNNLLSYAENDYNKYNSILSDISHTVIWINDADDYWTKVNKIQKFVHNFGYEYDLLYLGKDGTPLLTDYQLPTLANLIIGRMDCNNKSILFVQLCRVNNILSGIVKATVEGDWHILPVVLYDAKSDLRKHKKPTQWLSFSDAEGKQYHWLFVEVTGWDGVKYISNNVIKTKTTPSVLSNSKLDDWYNVSVFWPK